MQLLGIHLGLLLGGTVHEMIAYLKSRYGRKKASWGELCDDLDA